MTTTTTKTATKPKKLTLQEAVAQAAQEARMEHKNQVLDELDLIRESVRTQYLFPAKALATLDAVQDAILSLEVPLANPIVPLTD